MACQRNSSCLASDSAGCADISGSEDFCDGERVWVEPAQETGVQVQYAER